MLFTKVEDAVAILTSNGVYKQTDVYIREGMYYAKHGGGYIMLRSHNGTSVPKITWTYLEGFDLFQDRLGRLCNAATARAS